MQADTISKMSDYGYSLAKSLLPEDPRISAAVFLSFNDGSKSSFARAYTECVGGWLYVITVDDGYFLFKKADVSEWTSDAKAVATVVTHTAVAHECIRQRSSKESIRAAIA